MLVFFYMEHVWAFYARDVTKSWQLLANFFEENGHFFPLPHLGFVIKYMLQNLETVKIISVLKKK